MKAHAGKTSLDAIDWSAWSAVDRATLLFVIRDGQILLIRKKRGLGAGKINGPGGKLDPGETWRAAAIREAADRGATLICLPELYRSRYFCQNESEEPFALAEAVPGPATERLSSLAKELGICLVASLFERRAASLVPPLPGGSTH